MVTRPADVSLSPRQRCLATLANHATDRAPTYLTAMSCTVASELLGRPTYAGTGALHFHEVAAWADGEQAHADFEAKLEADLLALFTHLQVDAYHPPWRMNVKPTKRLDEYTFLFGDPDGPHAVHQFNPESEEFAVIREVGGTFSYEDELRTRRPRTRGERGQDDS